MRSTCCLIQLSLTCGYCLGGTTEFTVCNLDDFSFWSQHMSFSISRQRHSRIWRLLVMTTGFPSKLSLHSSLKYLLPLPLWTGSCTTILDFAWGQPGSLFDAVMVFWKFFIKKSRHTTLNGEQELRNSTLPTALMFWRLKENFSEVSIR